MVVVVVTSGGQKKKKEDHGTVRIKLIDKPHRAKPDRAPT